MLDRPLVMVGFVSPALPSVAGFQSPSSVIVIEEPDVVRKRNLRSRVAASPVARALIEWKYQLEGAADAFVRAHPDLNPIAVGPLTEYATPFAARLSERYGMAGAGAAAADRLRDKALLRHVTRAAGIPNPESRAVDVPADVREFMAVHPGPVVLKPANRQASVGTKIVQAAEEVDQAWAECVEQDEGVMVPDRGFPLRMLVETYVSGHELSVEMLVDRGVPVFSNVTDKLIFPGPRPIELGHVVPAAISDELDALLRRQTEAVLRAVGFGTGNVHCEWIVHGGTPYLIECAGRFAGDGIVELIERAYGIELVRSFWSLLKGETLPPLPKRAGQVAAVRFLMVEPGEVRHIAGLEEAGAVPGVISAEAEIEVGEHLGEPRSSWDRAASAIAVGPTSEVAMRRAEAAISLVRIETAPAERPVAP
jgi:biotin carboxylase